MPLLIKNGEIVTADARYRADIYCQGETITRIGADLTGPPDTVVIDAAGKLVFLIATPRELDAMTPEYRARLKLVAKSNLIGGGGPPALYEISPGAAK